MTRVCIATKLGDTHMHRAAGEAEEESKQTDRKKERKLASCFCLRRIHFQDNVDMIYGAAFLPRFAFPRFSRQIFPAIFSTVSLVLHKACHLIKLLKRFCICLRGYNRLYFLQWTLGDTQRLSIIEGLEQRRDTSVKVE
jgi:hypothetical protein